jgi:hypothetical protein
MMSLRALPGIDATPGAWRVKVGSLEDHRRAVAIVEERFSRGVLGRVHRRRQPAERCGPEAQECKHRGLDDRLIRVNREDTDQPVDLAFEPRPVVALIAALVDTCFHADRPRSP